MYLANGSGTESLICLKEARIMSFEEWWQEQDTEFSEGMYSTYRGNWIYEQECRELWDSIVEALGREGAIQ
jgi:hypothetical protein